MQDETREAESVITPEILVQSIMELKGELIDVKIQLEIQRITNKFTSLVLSLVIDDDQNSEERQDYLSEWIDALINEFRDFFCMDVLKITEDQAADRADELRLELERIYDNVADNL